MEDRRRRVGLALYEGGYEVINAIDGDEALRYAVGLGPALVIAHADLEGMKPIDLCRGLRESELESPPPVLILSDGEMDLPDDLEECGFFSLRVEDIDASFVLQQVRLLLLARHIGGELNESIDRLFGDLTRVAIGDLLRVLQEFRVTGHVRITIGRETGMWFKEGELVDAHWTEVGGRKAFNRIAGLRGGAFILDLEEAPSVRTIDLDLATLVTDAVEEKLVVDDIFKRLPSLHSRVEVSMGEDFFNTEFSDVERAILTLVHKSANLAELIDTVPFTDGEVLQSLDLLRDRQVLVFHEPVYRTHVVTDSTCDLNPAIARREDVAVVPLSVIFGKDVFKDGIDIMPDDFYRKLGSSNVFPSTSPPGRGEFLETYRGLIGTGDVVSIHISSAQSLTFNHALEAVEHGKAEFGALRRESGFMRPPNVRVVDSRVNSVGLGMLVRFAARMARRGLDVDEIGDRIEAIASRLQFLFAVDTLEYLRKGGRIGGARALIGTLLGIKPILAMEKGEVQVKDKVRGGRNVQPKLIELLKQEVDSEAPVFAVVGHASAPRWAQRLRGLLNENFAVEEVFEGEIGPIVGSHSGPGTIGCVLFAPDPEEMEFLRAD